MARTTTNPAKPVDREAVAPGAAEADREERSQTPRSTQGNREVKFPLAIGLWLLATPAALAQGPVPSNPLGPGDRLKSRTIHPAVVRIVAPGQGSISYGSGTLVYANDQYGLVITNWHVVNEVTGPISVHFPDGFYSIGSIQTGRPRLGPGGDCHQQAERPACAWPTRRRGPAKS